MQAIVATIVARFVVKPAPELLAAADYSAAAGTDTSGLECGAKYTAAGAGADAGSWPGCPDPPSMVPLRQRAVYHINLTAKDGLPLLFQPRT